MGAKYQVTVGALYREELRTQLQSLQLPFIESNSNWFSSAITVTAETPEDLIALSVFKTYCVELAERVAKVGEAEARELWKHQINMALAQRNEQDERKATRKSVLRRFVFRKN